MSGKVDLWLNPDSGRWYITWTERGRSLRVSTRQKDRGEAEKIRATFVLERGAEEPGAPKDVLVATLLGSYYTRHAAALPSAERIRYSIKYLKAFYGDGSVKTVTARNHERYIAQARSEGRADGTINRELGTLRAALRFAVKSGDLVSAPFVPSLREPPPRPHVLTVAQMAALLSAAKATKGHDHVETFIRIAAATGARKTAILQLTWDRVDLKAGTIDFRLPGVTHSRKRRAITGISSDLSTYLAALKKRTKGARVVQFNGKAVKNIKRGFATVAEAAGMPHVTPHVLKHTFVSQALQVASPWVVSGMTATSLRTLQAVYGKHMVEDQRKAAEAMAALTRKSRAKTSDSKKARKRVKR